MKKLMNRLVLILLILSKVLTSGCGNHQELSAEANRKNTDYFADNAFGNPLAMVQHPAGVHLDGVTYIAYQGPLEDPYLVSYDHNTDEWHGPFKAGVSEMGKDPGRKKKIDNHGKPTIVIDDLGYIHVFFGGHGGTDKHGKNLLGSTHYGRNLHAVSRRPRDISSWQTLDTIPAFGTYNQAVKMDNGDIYLFYRHGAHRSDWVYQRSNDHGRSFEPPVPFLKHKRRNDMKAVDSWYAWVGRGKGDDIIVSYDYHLCWDRDAGINGRGHTTERHDAYYMVFNTKDGTWRNVEGRPLAIPLTRELADKHTLVARTGAKWTFNGSAHVDPNGWPHIATNVGEDLGAKTGGPKQLTHYRWTGEAWTSGRLVDTQSRYNNTDSRGDFFLSSSKQLTFAVAYKEKPDGVVAYFDSTDGGNTFIKSEELLRRPGANWAVSAMIKNAHPDARVIVAEKQRGTDWGKVYLLGDNGPIQRPHDESQMLNRFLKKAGGS